MASHHSDRDVSARRQAFVFTAVLALAVTVTVPLTARSATPASMDTVGLVDTSQGIWHLRDEEGDIMFFFFGNPGDVPFMGDWDCDGVATPGLFRRTNGFVYLRNSNTQGVANIRFFFGNPGDLPIAGDFNGDGCDTVSVYRPTEGRFYIINRLGTSGSGLGAADFSYLFGNVGDKPFVGDFDGDGIDTVGLHRESVSLVYLRNSHTEGPANVRFIYGDPGDRLVAGDWDGDGDDGVGVFRPTLRRFFLKDANVQGAADVEFFFGQLPWLPVAGNFGDLEATPTTTTTIPPGTPFSFIDGIYAVGTEIPTGTYRNSSSVAGCTWTRTEPDGDVIATDSSLDIEIVTLEPGDGFFESDGCGIWSNDLTPRLFPNGFRLSPVDAFGDGHVLVPAEVAEGIWRSDVPIDTCSWELLSGFTGEPGDTIASATSASRVSVLISLDLVDASGDPPVGFTSDGCGIWTRTGPPPP